MVIKMNKIKIFLPIIKINVDCSIRTKEKCGLFEYTILYIYNQFNKNKFNNFTFKDFINKVLKAKVPDIFIEEALDYLNNKLIKLDSRKKLLKCFDTDIFVSGDIIISNSKILMVDLMQERSIIDTGNVNLKRLLYLWAV
jgi:hypothetical protein